MHCGGPLGRGALLGAILSRGDSTAEEDFESDGRLVGPFESDEESERVEFAGRGRNLVWVITAVVAMLMSALRACGGGA